MIPPSELIVTGNLIENWKTFKTDFQRYINHSRIINENAETKVAIFLNVIGANGLKIFNDLRLSESALGDIDRVIDEFGCRCTSNQLTSQRLEFYTRVQLDGESFDEFFRSLRKLAEPCCFGNQADMEIKLRIFLGLSDRGVRDQLENIMELTLDYVVDFCRTSEIIASNRVNEANEKERAELNRFNKSTELIVPIKGYEMERNEDNLCGFSGWHPDWLQSLTNPKVFLLVYGLLGTTQSMKHIYFNVTLTTLERRFKIPSETTGILMTGNEVSQILLSLILSYAGGGKNRPRWISWGVAICALSCFVLVLPHALYGGGDDALQYTLEYSLETISFLNETEPKLRDVNRLCKSSANQDGDCLSPPSMIPLILIFLSQFVLGIGNTLYYSLGHSYLDDSIKKRKTPMMLAYAMSLRFAGSAVGFALGYFALSVFIEPTKTPLISDQDPRWVGAWWLGWIFIGLGMLVFAMLVGMFPRDMPKGPNTNGSLEILKEGQKSGHDAKDLVSNGSLSRTYSKRKNPKLKDFPAAVGRILQNHLLIFNILSSIFFFLGASVYVTFLSKYMEVQFNRTKANATLISGPVKIFGLIAGFLLSGFFISKYRPAPRKLFFWNVIVGCSYMASQITYLFLFCDNGTAGAAPLSTGLLNLTNTCNIDCYCDNVPYSPVCHPGSNVTFFSPCHAGCRSRNRKQNVYGDCGCIDEIVEGNGRPMVEQRMEFGWNESSHGTAIKDNDDDEKHNVLVPGLCSSGCDYAFLTFNIIFLVKSILGGTGKIGNILLNLRAVSKEDKSIAQGLALMMLSLFAFIPGPILYGRIIDQTCLVWNSVCGERGYCQLYDQTSFRYHINVTAFGFTTIGVIFDILVWYLGKDVKLYDEDDEEENSKSI